MTTPIHPDPAMQLTDALCRIRSFDDHPYESDVATFISSYLRTHCPWLRVSFEEVARNRPNVIALDCDEEDVRLLIVGHTDTVPPSPRDQWTVPEFSVRDGRYYALGAGDTKGGIAAMLDAMRRAGPTRGVAYVFYVDEEYAFLGMKDFVRRHRAIRPSLMLSVCGGDGEMTVGCRGCIEFSFTLRGRSGHASRPHLSESAISAMHVVVGGLEAWCANVPCAYTTSINVAAVHGGLLCGDVPPLPTDDEDVHPMTLIPPIKHAANNVPDVAWALVDVRPGGDAVSPRSIRATIERLVAAYNLTHRTSIEFTQFYTRFHVAGYHSPDGSYDAIARHFDAVHHGRFTDPSVRGYIDVAMISSLLPQAGCVCLSPVRGREHSPDEWVDVQSLLSYRDCAVSLLRSHAAMAG